MFREAYSRDYQLKQAYEGRLICHPRLRALFFGGDDGPAALMSFPTQQDPRPGCCALKHRYATLPSAAPRPAPPHDLARAVASSPASSPPHPSVHSEGCCHQQLCFLPKHKVSRRH